MLLALQACRCLVCAALVLRNACWLVASVSLALMPLSLLLLQGLLATGGTTLIVHVLTAKHVYTANVGDCKSVLSR